MALPGRWMTALKTATSFGVATPTRAFMYLVLVLGVALLLTEHHLVGLDIGNAIPFAYSVATLKSHSMTEPSHRRQRASPEATSHAKTCSVNWGEGSDQIRVKKEGLPLYALENAMPNLLPGGRWFPTRCTARHRVAIVVPYWDRLSNLEAFLQHMHPFLQDQQLDYSIYLVEQNVTKTFNKARLYNAGYEIAKVLGGHDCFIFHDVDLLPENRRNEYACRDGGPFHLTTCIDRWNYEILYPGIFGGAFAMTSSHVEKVNGFSNVFWGWGGEDDDMAIRVQKRGGFSIVRNNCTVGRYTSLEHREQARNPTRYWLLRRSLFRVDKDGLNSLKYRVLDIVFNRLYTHILLDVFESTDKK